MNPSSTSCFSFPHRKPYANNQILQTILDLEVFSILKVCNILQMYARAEFKFYSLSGIINFVDTSFCSELAISIFQSHNTVLRVLLNEKLASIAWFHPYCTVWWFIVGQVQDYWCHVAKRQVPTKPDSQFCRENFNCFHQTSKLHYSEVEGQVVWNMTYQPTTRIPLIKIFFYLFQIHHI